MRKKNPDESFHLPSTFWTLNMNIEQVSCSSNYYVYGSVPLGLVGMVYSCTVNHYQGHKVGAGSSQGQAKWDGIQ